MRPEAVPERRRWAGTQAGMEPDEVVRRRLCAQLLRGPGAALPEDTVRHLLAVQAQEFPYARWSVGQRTRPAPPTIAAAPPGTPTAVATATATSTATATATALDIEQSVSDGRILRTHILRPTWHFVHRDDLRWLTSLSRPRLHRGNTATYRRLGMDAATFERSGQVLAGAVRGGRHLTREQLAARLQDAGFTATGLELAYLIMAAEINAVLASGSPVRSRGGALKQTYALFDERVPAGPPMPPTREESLAELARRYFTSRGPATVKDCAGWSGLTMAEVRQGLQLTLEASPGALETTVIAGVEHYFVPGPDPVLETGPRIDLIQCYDEYIMGYFPTRHYLGGTAPAFPTAKGPIHVVLLDGRMAGSWRHTLLPGRCDVDMRLLESVLPAPGSTAAHAMDEAVQQAVEQYGAFLGIPAARVGSGA